MFNKKQKGNIGEDAACEFLLGEDFSILARNYQKKWGELDIIAEKNGMIHFFEVKSVVANLSDIFPRSHTPEENVHGLKVRKLRRMIETYLSFAERGLDAEFQFHIICVYLNSEMSRSKTSASEIKWIKNVIL